MHSPTSDRVLKTRPMSTLEMGVYVFHEPRSELNVQTCKRQWAFSQQITSRWIPTHVDDAIRTTVVGFWIGGAQREPTSGLTWMAAWCSFRRDHEERSHLRVTSLLRVSATDDTAVFPHLLNQTPAETSSRTARRAACSCGPGPIGVGSLLRGAHR